jgi:hypothetical protein
MDQGTERRIVTQRSEDLLRLAGQAEREGVIIFCEPVEGRHFATSRRDATRLYRVTPSSCDCPGFTTWRRCGHVALLASQLGWIPDPVEAAPPAPVPVLELDPERVNELTERHLRAAIARGRMAARAADPGAGDRALAACTAARIARVAAGVTVARV